MNRANLELHIDKLVLHDLDLAQRHRLAAAIERALTQMFAERGVPGDLNAETLAIDASTIQVSAGAKADAIGAQVAQSIYSQIANSHPQTSLTEQNTSWPGDGDK
jgi:hypothetical protein